MHAIRQQETVTEHEVRELGREATPIRIYDYLMGTSLV